MIETLTADEVMAIHEELTNDFAAAADPISPSGVKSRQLLESAVSRQYAGFHDRLKYDTPIANAAALAYGVCSNHPFHNGNKRTSLVALLCHLDRNHYTFEDTVSQNELYEFMLKIASHGFADRKRLAPMPDVEVEEMSRWIRKRTRKIESGERTITFRELKNILSAHGFLLEDPRDNTMDLVRYEERSTWLGLRSGRVRNRIMRMGYPGDGQVVGKNLLRDVRKRCGLAQDDGVDSKTFYEKLRHADYFIAKYRRTLRSLARV